METDNTVKKESVEWQKIFANCVTDKRLTYRIQTISKTQEQQKTQFKNGQKT